jgi:glycosyltransferase involved in cell wall biosynthesis
MLKDKIFFVIFSWVILFFSVGYSQKNEHSMKKSSKPNIVIINLHKGLWRGIESHSLNCYKAFLKNGHKAIMIVSPQSELEKKLKDSTLPYVASSHENIQTILYQVCKDLPADIVISCFGDIVTLLNRIKKELPIKIVSEYHSSIKPSPKIFNTIDGLIATNQGVAETLKRLSRSNRMLCKYVEWMPPFFDQERLLNFTTQQAAAEFFKKNFNIKINSSPIVCMVGNMYGDVRFKNHPLLFSAIQKLIYERYKPVQVMLVGDGRFRKKYEALVKQMKLQKYVHFLGFSDQVPAVLYHSDINILTSSKEAFGLVYVEAGLMKKPSIGATETGATSVIQNGETGFLFINDDVNSLVEKMLLLLKNPSLRLEQGNNAYAYVLNNFSTDTLYIKYHRFLMSVLGKGK